MDFDYKQLGSVLAWNRTSKNLRQVDLEIRSDYKLKQPAISAIERGETRMAVDTLVEYCNALGVRPDMVLDAFLTTPPESESSDIIVDPYVLQLAKMLEECPPEGKTMILQMIAMVSKYISQLKKENQQLKDFYGHYEEER